MDKETFAIAFSEREQAEAIKEISLKIKLIFPKKIDNLIILFTPDYNPKNLLDTIGFTLNPDKVLGLQSPLLIFEEKVISKGVVACCMNKDRLEIYGSSCPAGNTQEVESFLTASFKNLKRGDLSFFSFISPGINPVNYIRGARISLGRFFELVGTGFTKRHSSHESQIINNALADGLISVAIKGIKISSMRLGGYVPLGRPFTITKTTTNRDIIMEIDNRPAVNIYEHYLQEKFQPFVKNHLFSFYPLGIATNGSFRLVNVVDCLEDGSLVCLGEAQENESGHIMFLDSALIIENLKNKLASLRNNGQALTFIINSLTRKKTLGEVSKREVAAIKETLGDKSRVIGVYADYSLFSDKEKGNINIEAGNLLVTTWE